MGGYEREWLLREFDHFRDLSDSEVDLIGRSAPMSELPAGQTIYAPDRPTRSQRTAAP